MILTWFNNNNGTTYVKFYKSYLFTDYYVGYINSYNHVVVQMLFFKDNKMYNVSSYNDFVYKSSKPIRKNKVFSFFRMLI